MQIKFFFIFVLCVASAVGQDQMAQSMQVQALEQQITKDVQMQFDNYKLYPFAIAQEQEFLLSFSEQQTVKGEMRANWVEATKKQLMFPTYDAQEFIKLSIVDLTENKLIQQRKFHFQTGIHFTAQAKRRYKLIFKDFGSRNKMVELALSHIQPFKLNELTDTNLTNSTTKAMEIGKKLESQFVNLAVQSERSEMAVQGIFSFISNNMSRYFAFAVWEILLVSAMMISQIVIFRKLLDGNKIAV